MGLVHGQGEVCLEGLRGHASRPWLALQGCSSGGGRAGGRFGDRRSPKSQVQRVPAEP